LNNGSFKLVEDDLDSNEKANLL